MTGRRRLQAAQLLLFAGFTSALLYVRPYQASELRIVPDSVEYAVSANRLVTLGAFNLEIEHRGYPSRYPPWFPVLFVAPTYLLAGPDLGNAIYPVTLFAMAGLFAAWMVGCRFGTSWSGLAGSSRRRCPTAAFTLSG